MVLVEDECRVQRESSIKSIWYRKGTYPTIKVDQKKEGRSFYGALDVKTGKDHVWDCERQNSAATVCFLRQLEDYYQGKQVLLLWDGAPSHRGKVKAYLRERKRWQLTLVYFPPYSPDLNPQEHVWKQAKQATTHNSEDSFDNKLYKFRQYLVHITFTTNFLEKYT